ncbi:MAG: hypothetical protein Q8R36_01810 [bacterium]|nr:hypothetical protein [bacterium]
MNITKELRYLIYFVFLATVSTIVFFIFDSKNNTFENYAAAIFKACEKETHRPPCYDREIPKLMDVGFSMEDAFAVTRLVQEKDDSYFYCHVLGHNLSAKETAKDPSRWKEVIARAPSGLCSNGAIHGAFQERYRAESLPEADIEELEPILKDICKERKGWSPTHMEQATCTHAVGHLTMYVSGGDIYKSLALCERVAFNESGYDFRQICFDGAFMQIFQPLEPEDYALIKGKEPTLLTINSFCADFTEMQYGSCRSESWPLYREQIKTAEGLTRFCSLVKNSTQKDRCYSGMFYVITAIQLNLDPKKVTDFCALFGTDRRGQCFANAASRMIETDWRMIDRAVSLCKSAENYESGDACYKELIFYSTYNFHAGSKEFFTLCDNLPIPWKQSCYGKS